MDKDSQRFSVLLIGRFDVADGEAALASFRKATLGGGAGLSSFVTRAGEEMPDLMTSPWPSREGRWYVEAFLETGGRDAYAARDEALRILASGAGPEAVVTERDAPAPASP